MCARRRSRRKDTQLQITTHLNKRSLCFVITATTRPFLPTTRVQPPPTHQLPRNSGSVPGPPVIEDTHDPPSTQCPPHAIVHAAPPQLSTPIIHMIYSPLMTFRLLSLGYFSTSTPSFFFFLLSLPPFFTALYPLPHRQSLRSIPPLFFFIPPLVPPLTSLTSSSPSTRAIFYLFLAHPFNPPASLSHLLAHHLFLPHYPRCLVPMHPPIPFTFPHPFARPYHPPSLRFTFPTAPGKSSVGSLDPLCNPHTHPSY